MNLDTKVAQTIAKRQHIAALRQEARKLIAEYEVEVNKLDAVDDWRLIGTRAAQIHTIKLLFIRATGEQLEV